jgi:glycosyltransferase involved in cell wall biosynthesis
LNPAIVISAYNRSQALIRLLTSLQKATYPPDQIIPLVISLDAAGDNSEVAQVAGDFHWQAGPKTIIPHQRHLGPVPHFYACGDLTASYGDIIYLEDDLVVSPVFYHYAWQALSFFRDDERIGGLSLYGLWFNGYTQEPFVPLADEADHFFLQVPYTQGQVFSKGQWARFKQWRETDGKGLPDRKALHAAWFKFREDEWFPWLTRYLVDTGRYYVFPRVSLATGAGDRGTHFSQPTSFFQAPLQRGKTSFSFKSLDQSLAVYDSFFEISPERLNCLAPGLQGYRYTVDLYATRSRQNIQTEYVLTSRPCRRAVASYGKAMWPLEANIEYAVPGKEIFLCRAEDLRWDRLATLKAQWSNYSFFNRRRRLGIKRWLAYAIIDKWYR